MPLRTDPISQADEAYKAEVRKRDNNIRALGTEIEQLKKQNEKLKQEQVSLQSKVDELNNTASKIEWDLAARRKEFDATQDKLRAVLADKEQTLIQSANAQKARADSLDQRHQQAGDRENAVEVKKALLINILSKAGDTVKSSLDKEIEQLKGI